MTYEIAKTPVDPTQFPEAAHKFAQQALREHQRAEKDVMKAVEHAVKSGQALLKAYDLCEYGQWEAFFEMHFPQHEEKRMSLRTDVGVCAGTSGDVYFIEAIGVDRVKIGVSSDVGKRFGQLASSFPGPLKLLGRTAGGRAREASLHRRLANFHIGGEWFHLTSGVRAVIREVIDDDPE
jgi:hypothetical protein